MALKVLLINAIDTTRRVEAVYPPLNLAYLASYAKSRIKNEDIEFKIISKDYKKTIGSFSPDFVGISSVTQNYPAAVRIASYCRKNNIPVFIGGVHISALPKSIDRSFDFAVIGEGEDTFVDIIRLFIKKGAFKKEDIKKIGGLAFYDRNLILTSPRKSIEDIDSIPPPARELIDMNRSDIFMMSSRGCPYNCYFCSSSSFWKKIRFHSADYVINEIEEIIRRYKPEKINFYDDLFIANKKRLKEIVEKIEGKRINRIVRFHISARANLVDEETAGLLKRMNVKSVNIGFESGSEKILKYLKGNNINLENNREAIGLINKQGILIGGSFVMGCPIETKETLMETYNFIKNSKIDTFAVYALTPYPNTPAWDYALKQGMVSYNMDFSLLTIDYPKDYKKKIILCQNMSKEELYKFHKKFLNLYRRRQVALAIKVLFKRPGSILRNIIQRFKYMDFEGFN